MDFPRAVRPTKTQVARFRTLDQLAPLATDWDRLARGVPFRSWAWMSNWWRHYGHQPARPNRNTELFVLGVFDQAGALIGIAPWYRAGSAAGGRVLRFLGTGEVCSDYLSVLCEPAAERRVAQTLAGWLTEARSARAGRATGGDGDCWDLLELTGVDARDETVSRLAQELEARGNTVHRRTGPNCWRIELPATWEQYLDRLSKDHRRQIRRAQRRVFATGRAVVRSARRLEDLPEGRRILVDLHQRRRRSLGQPGCFASARFLAFHREAMSDLLRDGWLRLEWLEMDGRPVSAEYQLAGRGVVYAYQGGIHPAALSDSPGRLSTIVALRRAIEEGYRAFDFLRGDEPFKAHWRAEPRPGVELRVVPAQAAAQLRHGIWLAAQSAKEWIKSALAAGQGEGKLVPQRRIATEKGITTEDTEGTEDTN